MSEPFDPIRSLQAEAQHFSLTKQLEQLKSEGEATLGYVDVARQNAETLILAFLVSQNLTAEQFRTTSNYQDFRASMDEATERVRKLRETKETIETAYGALSGGVVDKDATELNKIKDAAKASYEEVTNKWTEVLELDGRISGELKRREWPQM